MTELFKAWHLSIFSLFYLGQGYSLASLALLLPLYILNELGARTYAESYTISAIMLFPWYIKIVFGLISDNFPISKFGRRKPYLMIATLFSAFGWLTLGIHQTSSIYFIISGICLAIGSALADTVIDALAVEITPQQYISRIQGVAWGSRGLGIGLAGIIATQLVVKSGWLSMFYITSIFGIGISIIVLILPEADLNPENYISKFDLTMIILKEYLKSPKNKYRFLFFFLSGSSLAIVPLLAIIMEMEFHYSVEIIGFAALTFAIGAFFGAILNGILFDIKDTFSRIKLLIISFSTIILTSLIFVFLNNIIIEFSFYFLIGMTSGAFEGYQLKVIQEETEERLEGTIFSLWTSVSNLGQFAFGGFIIIQLAVLMKVNVLIPLQITTLFLILCLFLIRKMKYVNLIDTEL
ncbi:MAG: MFS transporter [Candidatus Heimdallarchaeota archaeon]|nr:MFS transporter [Candidatus Heimdallarchaeota archaeon]